VLKRHCDFLATINTVCAAINRKMVDTAVEGIAITGEQARLFLDQRSQIEVLLSDLLRISECEVYLIRSARGEFKLISLPWHTDSVGFDKKLTADTIGGQNWERMGRIFVGRAALTSA